MYKIIKEKLLILSVIPVLFILILSFVILSDVYEDKKNLELTKDRILESEVISRVVHFMQIERGLVSGFLTNYDMSGNNNLTSAANNLDKAIEDAKYTYLHITKNNNSSVIDTLNNIKLNRKNIFFQNMSASAGRDYYTKNISILLNIIKTIPSLMDDKENRNFIQAYSYLSLAKESLGLIRATLIEVFISNLFSDNIFLSFAGNLEVYNSITDSFKTLASNDVLNFYKNNFRGQEVNETFKIINSAIKNKNSNNFGVEPYYWFEQATKSIDLLKKTEDELFNSVDILIGNKLNLIFYKMAVFGFFLAIAIVALAVIMTNIIKRILFSTNTLEQKHDDSISLLEQYKSTVDRSFIVSKTDPNGVITYVNDEFCNTCGYEKDEVIGKSHNIVRHQDMPKELFQEMWHTIKELKQPWFGEIKNLNKNGMPYWVKVIINPVIDTQGNIIEYIGIKTDITKITNALITDFLTGYENRFKLNSDISESENLSIAIFNIDNFRQFNDFYGHSFGDKIIISIANIITNIISEHKNLKFYRLQSDEFAVLAQNEEKDTFIDIIYKILTYIKSNNITLDQEVVFIRCSCGISFESKENLFSTADMALKVAKKSNDDYIIFDESISLNQEYEKNIKCTRKLSNAIKEGYIITYYQPIVNNSDLSYEKYECLVRMIDGNRVISPYFFLEVAKQTRQYLDITKTVIYQSFEMFKDKEAEFSINLSIMDILEEQIVEYIFMMLEKYKIGSRVVFEIVESEYIENFEGVMSFINRAKKYNCKIAIDDFGTGYSNFEYIVKLKADYLKIDGSFIKNIDKDENAFLVVSTIVKFSKKLGMKIIAEFVENEKILKIVKDLGIDYSQGYYFSEPKRYI